MKYRFYTISEKAWLAMLEAISAAKKSIYLESFILTDDPVTHGFFEALIQKARDGIKVKIIIDRLADLWFGSINKEEFKRVGAEVLVFSHIFYRSHRKILIVDEEIVFLGGVNVRGEYARWLDLQVRITGVLVHRLLRSFSRTYELAGGRDPEILNFQKSKKLFKTRFAWHKAKLWLLERWPFKGRSELRRYYQKKLREAHKSVTIVTPYFIPHRWLIKSLRAACRRGVKIEIIVPAKTDFGLANVAHRIFADNLKDVASFLFIPEMNHAKVFIVDDREGLIGSNNIDAQSFDFNLEASIVFQRKDMVGDLRKILERWKKTAAPAAAAGSYQRWYHRLLGFFIRFFQPIL
jgi:cardiolipin synthase